MASAFTQEQPFDYSLDPQALDPQQNKLTQKINNINNKTQQKTNNLGFNTYGNPVPTDFQQRDEMSNMLLARARADELYRLNKGPDDAEWDSGDLENWEYYGKNKLDFGNKLNQTLDPEYQYRDPIKNNQQYYHQKIFQENPNARLDTDGHFGEFIDASQSSLAKYAADTAKTTKSIVNEYFVPFATKINNALGIDGSKKVISDQTVDKWNKRINDFSDRDHNDKYFGVNKESRVRQQKLQEEAINQNELAEKALENDDYVGYINHKSQEIYANILNTPMAMGDSAAETLSLANPATFTITLANRTNNAMDEYEELYGEKMSKEKAATITALNALSLYGEKLIFGRRYQSAKSALIGKSKTGEKITNFLESVGSEYTQERFDTAIEEFAKSKDNDFESFKKAWNSREAKAAGVAGMTMVGELSAASQTGSSVASVINDKIEQKQTEKLAEKIKKQAESKMKELDPTEETDIAAEEYIDKDTAEEPITDAEEQETVTADESSTEQVSEPTIEDIEQIDTSKKIEKNKLTEDVIIDEDKIEEFQEPKNEIIIEDDYKPKTKLSMQGKAKGFERLDEKTVSELSKNPKDAQFYMNINNQRLQDIDNKLSDSKKGSEQEQKLKGQRRLIEQVSNDLGKIISKSNQTETNIESAKLLKEESGLDLDSKIEKMGINVEKLKDSENVKHNSRKKRLAFDTGKVDDEFIGKVINLDLTKDDILNILGSTEDSRISEREERHLVEGETGVLKVLNNLGSNLYNQLKQNKTLSDKTKKYLGDNSVEKLTRAMAILLSNIYKSRKSEADIQDKLGFIKRDDPTKPLEYTRASNIYTQVGKEYVNSYGLKLSGPADIVTREYAKLGKRIVDLAKETDLVKTFTDSSSDGSKVKELPIKTLPVLENLVDPKSGEPFVFSEEEYSKFGARKAVNLDGKKILTVEETVLEINEEALNPTNDPTVPTIGYSSDVLSRIFRPSNYELPSAEPRDFVPVDRSIDENHLNIIKRYNQLKYQLKDWSLDLIDELIDRKKRYNSTDEMIRKDIVVRKLLKIKDNNLNLRKSNEDGRHLNRTVNLIKLLDNIKILPSEFHYSYESAINQRIHVMETILEFQGDKYMARQMITGEEYTTKGKKEADIVIRNISDESGLSYDEIVDPKGDLLDVMKYMEKQEKNGNPKIKLNDAIVYSEMLNIQSPFKAANLINAIYDVYKAENKEHITTNYMVEFDMSASGVINTMINLIGLPGVKDVVDKFMNGLSPYNYLSQVVEKTSGVIYDKKIKPILDDIFNISPEFTTKGMAKYVVMTWFYGSKNANVAENMSNDLAVDIVEQAAYNNNQKAIDFINKIIGSNYSIDPEASFEIDKKEGLKYISDLSRDDFNKLKQYLNDNLATYYVEALPEAFPGVNEYRNKMGKIYDVLMQTEVWDNTIKTPITALEGLSEEERSKYKASLKKEKASLIWIDEQTYVPLNEMYDNRNSFFVNLQHLSDAAQLLTTLAQYMKTGNKAGMMSVHDAIFGNANHMQLVKDSYEKLLKETALKYDYLQTALNEGYDAVKLMPKSKEKTAKVLKRNLDNLKKDIEEYYENKKLIINDDFQTNFFGDQELGVSDLDPDVSINNLETYNTFSENYRKVLDSKPKDFRNNLISFVENLNVKSNQKDKVLDFLKNNNYEVLLNDVFGGLDGRLYVDKTSVNDPLTNNRLTDEKLLSILGHEIDHAIQMRYIYNNLDHVEVKYLGKVVDSLEKNLEKLANKIPNKIYNRLVYIVNPMDKHKTTDKQFRARQISELSSIYRNEPEVIETILKSNGTPLSKVISAIKRMINKAIKWAQKALHTPRMMNEVSKFDPQDMQNTLQALELLDARAKIYTSVKNNKNEQITPAGIKRASSNPEYDVYKDMYLNPLEYASDILNRQNNYISSMIGLFGSGVVDTLAPYTRVGHRKLKRMFPVYRDVVHLLRSGFVDSEFAQKMRSALLLSNDYDEKLMNEMHSLATDVTQRINTYLTKDLTALDNRIKDAFPDKKDQDLLYDIFAKTGISGLQYDNDLRNKIFNNEISIKDAISEITKDMDKNEIELLKDVANYYVTGITKTGNTNLRLAGLLTNNHKIAVSLFALDQIKDSQKMLNNIHKQLRDDLFGLTIAIETLSDKVNGISTKYTGSKSDNRIKYELDFDGNYMIDNYDYTYDYRLVSVSDMKRNKYSSDNEWIVVKEPKSDAYGIVARKQYDVSFTPGVGLNSNVFKNGFFLNEDDSQMLLNKLNKMNEIQKAKYLRENMIIQDGWRFRLLIDEKTKREKLGLNRNLANTLMKTYAHNAELIQTQSIRNLILEKAVKQVDNIDDLDKINKMLKENRIKKTNHKLPLFVSINYDYGKFDDLPSWIKKYYKVPKNLSTYNNFNKKITLVKKAEADELLGYKNASIFEGTDYRSLARLEKLFKELIVLAKQKMVILNPVKLGIDMISNFGVLTAMDVPLNHIYKYYNEGLDQYKDFSSLRGQILALELEYNKTKNNSIRRKLDALNKKLKNHKFYTAFKFGFDESYSTDLVTKEFSTVTGLQKDINDALEYLVKTSSKDELNMLGKAIKWYANVGFGIEDVVRLFLQNKVVGENAVAKALLDSVDVIEKHKKRDDIIAYLNEYVGGPNSQALSLGSSAMVTTDLLSKYILANSLLTRVDPKTGKLYSTDKAYMIANNAFIDYRRSLPRQIKVLSDYGIILFPAFLMKVQKVLIMLLSKYPLTTIPPLVIEEIAGIGSVNVFDANVVSKTFNGDIFRNPLSIIDTDILYII